MNKETGSSSRRIGAAAPVLWALAAICLAYAVFRLHGFYQDDALIALTYARNLLAGDGLSSADGERIEGYSNFLFVVLTAGVGALGVDLVAASRLVGATFGIATAIAGLRLWATSRKESGVDLGAPTKRRSRACTPSATDLTASGGLVGRRARDDPVRVSGHDGRGRGVARPGKRGDGAGGRRRAVVRPHHPHPPRWRRPVAGGPGVRCRPRGGRRARMQPALVLAAATAAVLVPYAAWKLRYFGDLLPNTWYAKSAGIPLAYKLEQGLSYLWGFIGTPPAVALFAVAALVLRPLGAARGGAIPLAAWSCLAFATYEVAVGGDFMAHFRSFAPLVPLLALVVVGVARELLVGGRDPSRSPWRSRSWFSRSSPSCPWRPRQAAPRRWSRRSPGPTSRATGRPGRWSRSTRRAPSLTSTRSTATWTCWASTTVASPAASVRATRPDQSSQGRRDYVLARQPDYLLLGFPYGDDELEPVFLGDREILADPRLAEDSAR